MLEITQTGPVTRFILNRPEVRNALNRELIDKLLSAFDNLGTECRAVVIEGNGPAFCAGADLEWMKSAANYPEEENNRDAMRAAELFELVAVSKPVTIVKAHGACFGGGAGIVASADYSVASADAKFCFSEIKLGLIPATISPYVINKVGAGHARALFTTGVLFSGTRAHEIGLVNCIAQESELENEVKAVIKSVLLGGPEAIADARQLCMGDSLSPEESARRLAIARSREEAKEGLAAFLEKRKPNFAKSLED